MLATEFALCANAAARKQEDFDRLARYADILNSDVIGLEEVNSVEAVQRILGKDDYDIIIDGRRDADITAGRKPPAEGGSGANETDGIYVALAVRKGRAKIISHRDVEALSVMHHQPGEPDRPTRRGLEALVELGGRNVTFLVIHLKSGCHEGRLRHDSADFDCRTLADQVPILKQWIEDHKDDDFAILGDWNRRIELHSATDDLWDPIDVGGDVEGPTNLMRYPFHNGPLAPWLENTWVPCPTSPESSKGPIDYIALSNAAAEKVVPGAPDQIEYSTADVAAAQDASAGTRLFDHCPYVVDLKF
jgi:endonuclease/exonuclease/phosphatase family metal-dependent hydrolase